MNHGNEKNGEAVIHFDLKNAGIGPATIDKLVVRYDGRPVGQIERRAYESGHGRVL
jgi:hypothetical protein